MQERIENYWTKRACSYSERTQEELGSFKKEAWLNLILQYAPREGKMQVLDIGTGPGFFPIILSQAGHKVIGIDCAEEMLVHARLNSEKVGVSPDFMRMDCHKLTFEDESFDLVICRNLTWTLQEPESAYTEWCRVLKPGGRLLVFDANWYLWIFDVELKRQYEENMRKYKEMDLKNPHEGADVSESEKIARKLPMSSRYRPQWDMDVLKKCGFSDVFSEKDISNNVWDETEKIAFCATPMFLVGAEK